MGLRAIPVELSTTHIGTVLKLSVNDNVRIFLKAQGHGQEHLLMAELF